MRVEEPEKKKNRKINGKATADKIGYDDGWDGKNDEE